MVEVGEAEDYNRPRLLVDEVDQLLLGDYAEWAREQAYLKASPFVAVSSHRRTGKTRLFTLLSQQQPHQGPFEGESGITWVHWDLEADPRVHDFDGFWRSLGAFAGDSSLFSGVQSGETAASDSELQKGLSLWADVVGESDTRPILVLDHWAEARHGGGVPQVDLRALHLLTDALSARSEKLPEGAKPIGVFIPTGFPTVAVLLHWARRLQDQSPGLYRMSGTIDRLFDPRVMPFLKHATSTRVCEASGVTANKVASEIARFTGGWLGPLTVASQAVISGGESSFTPRARQDTLSDIRAYMREVVAYHIDEEAKSVSTLSADAQYARALERMVRDVESGLYTAEAQGVPLAGCPQAPKPAGALYELFEPARYLVVDVENIGLHFAGSSAAEKKRVYAALKNVQIWDRIQQIADRFNVPAGPNVVLAARNEQRVEELFGAPPSSWSIRTPGPTVKNARPTGDSNDDTAAAVFMAEKAALHPAAEFFIVSGDIDHIANVADHYPMARFHLLCPWEIGFNSKKDVDGRRNCDWTENVLVKTAAGPDSVRYPSSLAELLRFTP